MKTYPTLFYGIIVEESGPEGASGITFGFMYMYNLVSKSQTQPAPIQIASLSTMHGEENFLVTSDRHLYVWSSF